MQTAWEWFQKWLDVYVKPCKSPNTYRCYQDSVRRIRANQADFVDLPLSDISDCMVQEFLNSLAGKYSKSTLNHMRVVFHESFDCAYRNHLCAYNPIGILSIPQGAPEKKIRALTREEQNRVEFASNHDSLGHIVRFFLLTGLRAGELIRLEWQDYDRESGFIRIRQSKTVQGLRKVPLTRNAKHILDVQPHLCKRIFVSTRETAITDTVLRNLYERIRLATQIDIITTRVFRHTFATRALEAGMDYKVFFKHNGA